MTLRLRDGKHSNDEVECPYFVKLQQACGKQPRVAEAGQYPRCAQALADRDATGSYAVAACAAGNPVGRRPLKPLRAVVVVIVVVVKILLLLLLCDV
ncbi:hypothetical protein [Lysobacter sp. 22409]